MKRLPGNIYSNFVSPVMEFIRDSRAVGIILIGCTLLSLVISNSFLAPGYLHFWEIELMMPAPELHLPHTPLHVINDALMAAFFLLAGLEIKRELMVGELRTLKTAALPVVAALGGMVVPAIIYALCCGKTPFSAGWGIPMATDIAFSLGVLSLLGKKAPLSMRIFLTALAIIDDLGGILTIAIFYAGQIEWMHLFIAAGIFFFLILMNIAKVKHYYVFFLLGIFLWYFVYNSGVHATIAGVLLAFTIPLHRIEQIEHNLHDPVSFIILPLFALANTAIPLPGDFSLIYSSAVTYGIFAGLVLGKPLGIFLFSTLAVRVKWVSLPNRINSRHLLGMGMIAGIGFTMSIFMATLAFDDVQTQLIAKVAVIIASLVAGIAGFAYLKTVKADR